MKIKILVNSAFVLLSGVLTKAIPLLFVPILTRYIPPEGFGVIGFITAYLSILRVYVGFQPQTMVVVKGHSWSVLDYRENLSYLMLLILFSSILAYLLTIFLASFFFPEEIASYGFSLLLVLMCVLQVFIALADAHCQIRFKFRGVVSMQLISTFFHYGSAVLLVVFFSGGWEGKFYGEMVGVSCASVIAFLILRKDLKFQFSASLRKLIEIVKYLFPLTFHASSIAVMSGADRILVVALVGLDEGGVYAVGFSVGAIIAVVHNSCIKLWNPYFYKYVSGGNDKFDAFIVGCTYIYFLFSILVFILFYFSVDVFFEYAIDKRYSDGALIAKLVGLGYTIDSFRKIMIAYLYKAGKNQLIAKHSILSALLNIIFNMLLIPIFGGVGAAAITAISMFIALFLTVIEVPKCFTMPWLKPIFISRFGKQRDY